MRPKPEPKRKYAGVLRLYPELLLLPDDEERTRILRRGVLRGVAFAAIISGILAGPFNNFVITPVLDRVSPLPSMANRIIMAVLIGITCGLLLRYAVRKPTQRRFRRMLASRGIPVCLGCGYDLRGQTEPRCPECGQPFEGVLDAKTL